MKKLLISGVCALVVLAASATAGQFWAQAKAEAGVEQAFLVLRSMMTRAEHGRVAVRLWDRSVEISDIVLVPRAAPNNAAIKVARIVASGIDINGPMLSASRVDVMGFEAPSLSLQDPAIKSVVSVPDAVLDTVTLNQSALATETSSARVALSLFEAVTAQNIVVPRWTAVTTFPVPMPSLGSPDTPSIDRIEQTHTNTRATGIGGGKIRSVTTERAVITVMRAPAPVTWTVEMANMATSDLDMAALLKVAYGARGDTSGFVSLWRKSTVGPVVIKAANVVRAGFSGMTADDVTVDPGKVGTASAAIKALQPQPGQRPTPKQQQGSIDAAVMIGEHVRLSRFEINDIDIKLEPDACNVKLGSFQVTDLQGGKIGLIALNGLDVIAPQSTSAGCASGRMAAGRLAIKALNLSEMVRFPDRMEALRAGGGQPPATVVWPMALRLLDGFEIDGMTVPNPHGSEPVFVEQLKASWGPIVGQTPASGQIKLRVATPVSVRSLEPMAAFARQGLTKLDGRFNGRWSWQESTKTMVLGPVELDLAGVGAASAKMFLTNVSRRALIARLDFMPAAIQEIALGPVELTVRDQGLLKMAEGDPALRSLHQQTLASIQALVNPTDAPDITTALISMAKLMTIPDGSMTMRLTPKAPVTVGGLINAATPDPHKWLVTLFNAQVTGP
jgi:hypothetical protein